MPNPTIGGSEQTVPAHAKVIMLGFPAESTQVTRTTGQENNAVKGFLVTFNTFPSTISCQKMN
jgi:hypothetical protein